MPYGSMLHILRTNYHMRAAKQEPYQKKLSRNEKYRRIFWKKCQGNGRKEREKKKEEELEKEQQQQKQLKEKRHSTKGIKERKTEKKKEDRRKLGVRARSVATKALFCFGRRFQSGKQR